MKILNNFILGGIVVLALLLIGFSGGWVARKELRPCPEIKHDTIKIEDSYWHHIADSLIALPPKEKIKWLPQDTLYTPADTVFKNVDTLAILRDYYSVYRYHWEKNTDSLAIVLNTTVTKNRPIVYDLHYKFLKPFITIINTVDNTVTYNKYLYGGLTIPVTKNHFNELSVDAIYAFPKGFLGASWQPQTNVVSAKLGMTLIKFKQKK